MPIRSNAQFGSGAGHDEVAFAARYAHTIGPVDIGLSHFHGTGREPRLLVDVDGGQPFFQPFYEKIDQTGLDLQLTLGSWLWKLEAMTRSGQGDRINAVVGGFEYTFFDVMGTDTNVGLLPSISTTTATSTTSPRSARACPMTTTSSWAPGWRSTTSPARNS